mmetsp:Transcript_21293/g.61070  ORF Transcript_21293/g.61070 Transcript_21293/m.61070 type:complete len:878 (-) Transcript_21293:33-2666(-)
MRRVRCRPRNLMYVTCRNNEEPKEAPSELPSGHRCCRHLAFVALSMTLLLSVPSYALQNTPISYSSELLRTCGNRRNVVPSNLFAAKADHEDVETDSTYTSKIKDSTDSLLMSAAFRSRLRNLTGRIRSLPRKILPSRSRTADESIATVRDVHELRREVLQNRVPLKDIGFNLTAHPVNATTVTAEQLANHDVMKVISQRVRTNSTPGNRSPGDTAHLALAIEGGGMRGAVSAGMAAAIASLGLSDAFDSVYGSSAGCIVGAYMISRQMAVSVYTEVLPAAGNMFASKNRVIGNVGVSYVSDLVSRLRERGSNGGEAMAVEFAANGTYAASASNLSDDVDDTNVYVNGSGKSLSKRFLGRLSSMAAKVPILNKAPSVLSSLRPYVTLHPGMNLTFVIEGVMSSTSGLRPFDIDTFRKNDARQPLRAVSSTWRAGKMETVAFGSEDGDFWDVWVEGYEEEIAKEGRLKRSAKAIKRFGTSAVNVFVRVGRNAKNLMRRFLGGIIDTEVGALLEGGDNELFPTKPPDSSEAIPGTKAMSSFRRPRAIRNKKRMVRLRQATASLDDSGKKGFFACLESSMLVPGAAGKPVKLLRSKHRTEVAESGLENMTSHCFDAFCYEPIPFRSAVENGATHVLALRSRPDGCFLETKPYTYEKIVAPVYFRLNGLPKVGEFFEKSGSQYRYVEDVLTLDEGLALGMANPSLPVKVPPTEILFGTHYDEDITVNPNAWKSAHLLPIACKANTPELPALTQEKEEVVQAVREGFVAAFEMLSPVSPGLKFDPKSVDSRKIAELVFPISDDDSEDILEKPVQVQGDIIELNEQERERRRRRFARWIARKRQERRQSNRRSGRNPFRAAVVEIERENPAMVGGKEDELDWL